MKARTDHDRRAERPLQKPDRGAELCRVAAWMGRTRETRNLIEVTRRAPDKLSHAPLQARPCRAPGLAFLLPDYTVKSVTDLQPDWLVREKIQAVVLDLDGTLAPHGAEAIAPDVAEWVQELRARGIKVCLVTNGRRKRVQPFAEQLGTPAYTGAAKPLPFALWRAVRELGVEPHRALVVGDQIFTDVLAGRLIGARTVRVEPCNRWEPLETRIKRPWERLLLRFFQPSDAPRKREPETP